ncbi:MAG: alpha/beta hydrolase [Chloroflexi bacterium]|nr:MAG: alpha/beta hydrolase [Chloroflexota bacterium]
MKQQNKTASSRRRWSGVLIIGIVLAIIASLFIPWNTWALSSKPHPLQSYEEAAKRIEVLRAERETEMNPDCLLQFLTHGQKVQHAIILVHGYTSCPAQYVQLGQQFYDLGYNVLIAPLPHHGLADRLNDEQNQLKAKELVAYADEVVDIAHGLGEQISMIGISGGGVTTAWAAQNRSDINTAVIISPAFGYQQIPTRLTAPVMNVTMVLPDAFEWWDPSLKENIGPSHAYPRYSKHALVAFLKLGFAVQLRSWQTPPAARRIVMVTNANDTSVNNALTSEVVRRWQRQGANIEAFEFPLSLGLAHDLIDPKQPNQSIEIVYPQLIELAIRPGE